MKRTDELGPFFNLSSDLLYIADLNGRFTVLNAGWEKTLGFSTAELLSRPYLDFVHPNDRPSTLSEVARLVRRPTTVTFTNRYCCKDGSYKWLRWECSSELDHSQIYGVVRDVTEVKRLQKANQMLNSIIAASRDAIIAVDKRLNVRLWNPSAASIFGWTADEVLGGKVPFDTDDKVQESDWFNERALQGESFANHELRRTRRDGRPVDLVVCTATIYDDKGSRDGFVSMAADITEYKALEQQLLRAQRMGTLGTLAGGIAHDLNNVLAPIAMSLELFRTKLLDPDSQRTLDTLDNCVRHGADLIRQILTFARGLDGERVPVQTEHLIRQTAEVLLQTLPKSITVITRVIADLWPVFADITQLHQVLMNLCINARDAMPEGGELTISVRNVQISEADFHTNAEASSGPHVLLEVADTGHGISAEIRDKIFEPFFTTKGLGKGTGLGLSMVSAIVRNHGGFIHIDSEVGEGTSFKIYFPAIPDKKGEIPQEEMNPLAMGAGELILVVDDEAAVREIARVTLESYGYRVLEAADGAEALATYALHKDEIQLVISDMDMPVMNGAAMINSLERINPNVRVISASGMITPGKAAQNSAAPNPFRVMLPKPFTAAELLRTVRDVLQAA
jgi:two-component system cell cycle sensor histidine kinase/response regulator CckA